MTLLDNCTHLFIGLIILLSAIGVIVAKKPVHACLCFLLTLLGLASFYLQLMAPFISVMQVLVYAGAILVIFMFVIILFQDAYVQITHLKARSAPLLILIAALAFLITFMLLGHNVNYLIYSQTPLPEEYGSVQQLGNALYLDFFFPFEAVILLFLVAIVGVLYIGKKGELR